LESTVGRHDGYNFDVGGANKGSAPLGRYLHVTCVILSMQQTHRNLGLENRRFPALVDERGSIVAKPSPPLTEFSTHLAHIGMAFAVGLSNR
jgi:hypothetical protein